MDGGFPIDLLLFGMIAAFLVLRLRGILGRRTGFERRDGERPPGEARKGGPVTVPGMAPPGAQPAGKVVELYPQAPAAPVRALPDAAGPVGTVLARMRAFDPAFDADAFLRGGEGAFRMIVDAFARGDRVTLRPLLGDEMYRAFETAIAAREAAGETQRSEIRQVGTAAIEDASLEGSEARIVVRFVSDQVAETLDKAGRPVAGADAVTEITDLWTFERTLKQPDPAWRLTAARSG